jgi:hypothetical protein
MAYCVYEKGLKLYDDIKAFAVLIQSEVMLEDGFHDSLIILYFEFE